MFPVCFVFLKEKERYCVTQLLTKALTVQNFHGLLAFVYLRVSAVIVDSVGIRNVGGIHHSMSYVSIHFMILLVSIYDFSLHVWVVIVMVFWISDFFWGMRILDLNATKPWRTTGVIMRNFDSGVNTGK